MSGIILLGTKMRRKLSISINDEVVRKIDDLLVSGKFRNKSHIVEFALKTFLETEK